jgi:uncharacterized membrane protein HdeD (DUF308 family)
MGIEPERPRTTKRFMPTLSEVALIGLLLVGYIVIFKLASIYLYGINFAEQVHNLLVYFCIVVVVSSVVTLLSYLAHRRNKRLGK